MDRKLNTLYDLCETVEKELDLLNEKMRTSPNGMSAGDLEYLEKLTTTMKNLKCTIAMIEANKEGYSGVYWDGKQYFDGTMSMEGSSNRRGGGSRESRGRSNARGGGSSNRGGSRGYSRDEAREDFMEEVEELMEKAPDERTRMKFERLLNEMR